jgi:hypothetical protein
MYKKCIETTLKVTYTLVAAFFMFELYMFWSTIIRLKADTMFQGWDSGIGGSSELVEDLNFFLKERSKQLRTACLNLIFCS